MNVETLKSLLGAENVDPDAVSLDGVARDDTYVLEEVHGWTVYFAERGLRINEERFSSESEACSRLFELVLRDPTTRRP